MALLMGSCTKEHETINPDPSMAGSSQAMRNSLVPQPLKPVNLGSASSFAILSKYGITRPLRPASVTGDIGTSPLSGEGIHLLCSEVKGNVYIVPGAGPYPCSIIDPDRLSKAVSDMEKAYNNVAAMSSPNYLNLFGGSIGSIRLRPGLYKWNNALKLTNNIFLNGGPNDVYIFQAGGNLDVSPNVRIVLSGGIQARNVFWQSAGNVTIGEASRFQGVILAKGAITVLTDATVNGQLLAQYNVSLYRNTITHSGTSSPASVSSID